MAEGEVTVYRGIRYATVERRFGPPVPVPLARTPEPGGKFGPAAPQNPDPLDPVWGERLADESAEDGCLTLNIWTPAGTADTRRPVMVYIHGGAFIIGSGRWGWYEGTNFVRDTGVVLLTLNYRLGAFGFLDLSAAGGADYAGSANRGLEDQLAALRWVQAHIDRFGGDPDRVTVFGVSAGSISVGCLLGCPAAAGLFHRAVCMSGPPSMVRPQPFARRVTEKVLRFAGVRTADQLTALPAAALLAAQDRAVRSADFLGELMFGPTVDGGLLPRLPLHAVRDGTAAGVSVLAGTTLDEARLWSLYNPVLRVLPFGALGRWLRGLDLDPATLRAAYRACRPDLGTGTLAMAAAGDALFWLPTLALADAQAAHRTDTRVYLLTWRTPVRGGRLGSPHAVEQPLLFGNPDAPGAGELIGADPAGRADREAFARTLQQAWAAFARTGDPSHPGLPAWPAYEPVGRPTMILDRQSRLEADPLAAVRAAWRPDRIPFDGGRPAVDELPRIADVSRYMAVRGACGLAATVGLLAAGAWVYGTVR